MDKTLFPHRKAQASFREATAEKHHVNISSLVSASCSFLDMLMAQEHSMFTWIES
jgi:hypothetical protein